MEMGRGGKSHYQDVIKFWPIIGLLTGLFTTLILWGSSFVLPYNIACILAILSRVLLTGALHEDGLADFFDGFGAGRDKESILRIMKDSHIGCYGVIGLILYFILYYSILNSIALFYFPLIIAADSFSKLCAALMVNTLPYVRQESDSKIKLLYNKIPNYVFIIVALFVAIPFIFIPFKIGYIAIILTLIFSICIRAYLKKKIGGYTGDCCGASVLLIEMFFYLSFLALIGLFI